MSRFTEIEAFLQVSDSGSFTLAAEVLNLSRSRVSQLISRLEERVGVMLIQRTTRTLILTPEGEQFQNLCRPGMHQLSHAEANLKRLSQNLTGPVRINSVGGVYGETFLAKALAEAVIDHPELNISINYSSDIVDLNRDPIDLVLRIGKPPSDAVYYQLLGDVNHMLCASPSFLNKHGFPKSPSDIEHMKAVCGTPKTWSLVKNNEQCIVHPNAHWHSPSTQAQLIAAEQGLGIARLLTPVVKSSLESGRLVQVLPEWQVEVTHLWLLWRRSGDLPKRIEFVRDHLIQRLTMFNRNPESL